MNPETTAGLYERIYEMVRRVPRGHVASYGQIAELVGGCSARMIGYALSAIPEGADIPWHRIVNRRGEISLIIGAEEQRERLESEGIHLSVTGRIDLTVYGWLGEDLKIED